jgi:ribokinase
MQTNVLVVGSLNMDLVARAERLPRPGETLPGQSFATLPGGKGANQAVAAARLGASVAMLGCVGSDAYGEQLRAALLSEGIDTRAVGVVDESASGLAMIVVDAHSQNTIVIIPGANGLLSPARVQAADELLQAADIVIVQLEIPAITVGHVLERAYALGKTVILNPAPALGPLPVAWYAQIDYLIPNESEAQALSGVAVYSRDTASLAAARLLELGAPRVMITLGGEGVLYADAQGVEHFPASLVEALDSTAAGDTFVGGLAAALAGGQSIRQAIGFAQVAAALSVTRAGAQPSIPTLAEVRGFDTFSLGAMN